MHLLPDLKFYQKAFSFGSNKITNDCRSILYNPKNKLIINKSLIDIIETEIDDNQYFASFILEMSDNQQLIKIANSVKSESFGSISYDCYLKSDSAFTIPVSLDEDFLKENGVTNNVNLANLENTVCKDILQSSAAVKTVFDFKSNDEIQTFFNRIYSLPKHIKKINIFNRELRERFLKKGTTHHYYVLYNSKSHLSFLDFIKESKKLQKTLKNKSKIYYTQKRKNIHERKIIFHGLNITIDNDFNNIFANEKTWTITVSYCENTELKWMEKAVEFTEVK